MVTVNDVTQMMFRWAPPELAMDWDNVGLLVGRGDREVHRVLVALDVSSDVAAEAAETGTDLIVSHHPVMNIRWHAQQMQTLREDTRLGGLLTELVKRDISAICMHTNLDAAEGGVNDCLACTLGLQDTKPLNEEKIGRIGTLSCEKPLEQFLSDVVKLLSCNGLRYRDGGRPVHRVAVGGGACGEYIPQAIAQGCDTFVTSDLRYNDFLDTQGLNLIDAGHFPTEDVVCQEIVRRLRETLDNPANLCLHGVTDMQEAFIRLFSELITEDFLSPSLLEGTIHQIVGTAYRLFSQKRYRAYLADQARETDEKLVYDIIHYLDSHIADIGSLSGLSTVFGYSYTYLAHKFVSITGETLKTYAARRRFEKAREYLCRGMSITSVAEALGYQSIHAFSRAFHREIGLSPREYKRWAEDNRNPPGDSPILQKKELFP